MLKLDHVHLNGVRDSVGWKWEKSGSYTTKSMYKHLSSSVITSKYLKKLWKNKMPMKLKVFLWLGLQNKLQTGEALKNKNRKGDSRCMLCGVAETVEHILFGCVISSCVWSCFKEALGWDRTPSTWTDFLRGWMPLGCSDFDLKLFQFAIVAWSLWVCRNKIRIKGNFPGSAIDILYKSNLLL